MFAKITTSCTVIAAVGFVAFMASAVSIILPIFGAVCMIVALYGFVTTPREI
jgi:fatty acid desaturase